MNINIEYKELSLLRDILKQYKHSLWLAHSKVARHKRSDEYIKKAYKAYVTTTSLDCNIGLVNSLLYKIQIDE